MARDRCCAAIGRQLRNNTRGKSNSGSSVRTSPHTPALLPPPFRYIPSPLLPQRPRHVRLRERIREKPTGRYQRLRYPRRPPCPRRLPYPRLIWLRRCHLLLSRIRRPQRQRTCSPATNRAIQRPMEIGIRGTGCCVSSAGQAPAVSILPGSLLNTSRLRSTLLLALSISIPTRLPRLS